MIEADFNEHIDEGNRGNEVLGGCVCKNRNTERQMIIEK